MVSEYIGKMVPRLLFFLACFALSSLAEEPATITAGPFEIKAPTAWAKTAIVEKVPILPVYTQAEWKQYKANPMNILKPGYSCRPQHWAIRLPVLHIEDEPYDRKKVGDNFVAPQILIHKADEWDAASKNGEIDPVTAAKYIAKLRDEMEKANKEMRYGDPCFVDAEFHFETGRKRIDFKGGHGYRMLAQWTIEADFVHRGMLHYLFIGLSDDNTCQIVATIPVNLSGLPGKWEEGKHLGFSEKPYGKFTQDFDAYEKAVQKWLSDNLSKITPSLDALDSMIASLHAEAWK